MRTKPSVVPWSRRRLRCAPAFAIVAILVVSSCAHHISAADFDKDVAPLLAKRCLTCHNATDHKGGLDLSANKPALIGGDTGEVIIPGKPDASLLWERVSKGEMPPKKPLPEEEKKAFRDWLAGGATWGTDPIDPFRYGSDSRAGYDWWSLQPVRRPELPAVGNTRWGVNNIDRFVLAALEEKKLEPNGPADRRTLIRRLSFDLLGLPPTPEDVAAFVKDDSSDAYARLVDRFLDSPHYGERWGRHWLDVVRFGESQGFERDRLRPNAWPYRDWVIRAFNRDLPYDEFVRQQIAGDVLLPNDPLAIAATGFLVAAPWDEVGQTQQSAPMKAVVRQDELEDMIGVTSQTFLGLTAHCARCHDHKFDPVAQVDYYRLAASFAGTRHGERDSRSEGSNSATAEQRAILDQQVRVLRSRMEEIDAPIRQRLLAMKQRNAPPVKQPVPIARWDFDSDLKDAVSSLHGTAHGGAKLDGERLILEGKESFVRTAPLEQKLEAKSFEVVVSLGNLEQRGGAAIGVQTLDGAVFDALVFGEKEPKHWIAGSDGFRRTGNFQGEAEASGSPVHLVLVYAGDRTITCYRNGRLYGKPYQAESLVTFEPGKSQILFGLRHGTPGANKHLAGGIDRAALYDVALSAEQAALLAGVPFTSVTEDELLAEMSVEVRRQRNDLLLELSQQETELKLLTGGKVYAVAPSAPDVTHVLARGDTRLKQDVVTPGAVKCVAELSNEFRLSAEAPEGLRRVKLAQWIAHPQNPLTPRVFVNRLWHYHFGAGIVETPNDFGFNGGRPSHPQLLDWLARELVDNGWKIKPLQRQIVLSATYRQSARFNDEAAGVDAGNRLHWRHAPQRLDAETVRDAILCVSGELNPTMGGPGFRDFQTFVRNSQFYEMLDPVGHAFNRRTIYRTWIRSGRSDFLDVFDCPDPSTTAPKRAVTTTPLQALALLNNSFVLRMSDRFATRVEREAGGAIESQVEHVYNLVYGRNAEREEQVAAAAFVRDHGLPALCRVMFNSNEFLYVE